jgi:hypothetical protein
MSINPQPSKARPVVAATLAVMLLASALAAVSDIGPIFGGQAQAHVKFTNGKWVFRGRAIAKSGDRHDRKDPLNIIFMGHGRYYTNDGVFAHIKTHTGFGHAGPCATQQRVVWQKRNSTATTSDKDDFQMDNRKPWNCLGDRWHIRAWDDQEHDAYTDNHGRSQQWTVLGVHHEKGPPHKIDMDWDVVRRKFIKDMAGHCSWPRWKRHPGARIGKKPGQGYANSGWIGRISLKHTPSC